MNTIDWMSPPVVTTPCPPWCDGSHEERANAGDPDSPPSGDAVHRSAPVWVDDAHTFSVFVEQYPERGGTRTLLCIGGEAVEPDQARRFALAILDAADLVARS